MEKDIHKTDVIFYYDKGSKDVFAYFPTIEADQKGNKSSYAHIGQHSACSPDYIKGLKKAKQSEYNGLFNELESIGYDLNVLNLH